MYVLFTTYSEVEVARKIHKLVIYIKYLR